jgi:TRAP-type C4-dicarboxylate transport system substrate-binding protein
MFIRDFQKHLAEEGKLKKRLLLIGLKVGLLVSISVIMTSLVVSTPPAAAETITLKAVSFLPKHISGVYGMQMLVDKVNQQGKGEIKIKWLGGPEVMPPPAQVEAVKTGRIDMVIHSPENFLDKVPEVGVLHLSELTPMEKRLLITHQRL